MFPATPPRRISRVSARKLTEILSSCSTTSESEKAPRNVMRWSVAMDPVTAICTTTNLPRRAGAAARGSVAHGCGRLEGPCRCRQGPSRGGVAGGRPLASAEAVTAGAGAARVGVVDGEALLLDGVGEVDGGALEVGGAHPVDDDLDPAEV